MFLQVCDVRDNRHMGSMDLGDDYDVDDMPAMAEMMDRALMLAYYFDEGGRYELRVWDGDDVVWYEEYTYGNGRLF